jgi:hypothetical protein
MENPPEKIIKKLDGKMGTGTAWKVITITLIVLALMSATAFAYVGKPLADTAMPELSYQESNL